MQRKGYEMHKTHNGDVTTLVEALSLLTAVAFIVTLLQAQAAWARTKRFFTGRK